MLGRIWLLCRQFGWFKGVWGSLGEFASSQGEIGLYLGSFGVLRGLGGHCMVARYCRAYLALVQTIWVVLGGLKGRWVVLLDHGRIWPLFR